MTTTQTRTRRTAVRFAGLDGLRAVAVALVVIYHLFPAIGMRAGYIGVDVFFVISGFLITSLLLRRRDAGARGLLDFWRRRARRLLPALALTVTVCASIAWLIGGDVLVRIGTQLLGALTFSYNWVDIATGVGYFDATAPELFRNFWSLAVEEQFYLLWPLLLPLVMLLPRGLPRAVAALAAAAASAGWMIVLLAQGADATRVYFGTDTHAFGLLLGVALAFLFDRMPEQAWMRSTGARRATVWIGVAAAAALVLTAFLGSGEREALPGVLLAAVVLAGVLVSAAIWPGSPFGRALDVRPVKWFGDRSYGIYLWHWPVLVLVLAATGNAGPEGGVPPWIGVVTLAFTLVAAAVSFRLVETPVRRHGFRGVLARMRPMFLRSAGSILSVGIAAACVILLAGGTVAAALAEPGQSSAAESISAGQDAIADQDPMPSTSPSPSPSPSPSVSPSERSDGSAPVPSPTPVPGDHVTAVGDSVMLASAPALLERYPGISIDAEVSRSMWVGPGIIRSLADSGQLREYVVLGLGTNGPIDRASLEEILSTIGPDRKLIVVNSFAPRDWIPGVNDVISQFAAAHPDQVQLADWHSMADTHHELLAGDLIHPSGQGGQEFAKIVGAAVQSFENERAQRAYFWDVSVALGLIAVD